MPEGQSLVLAARRLAPIVGHEVTEGVLAGATIEAVEPYGKHLLIRTDDGRTLDVHLGMHGRVRLRPSGAGTGRHVLRRGVDDGGRLPRGVYKRGGRPCPRCGGPIRRDVQGEARRSTYWCPACAV